jgi:hypothetical protein
VASSTAMLLATTSLPIASTAASYITRARQIALKFDGDLFPLYAISVQATTPLRIINSTHLSRMKSILSPPGVGSDFRTDQNAALAAAKALLGTPDPIGAVKRVSVAYWAQAAQFAANVLPAIRDIQAPAMQCGMPLPGPNAPAVRREFEEYWGG